MASKQIKQALAHTDEIEITVIGRKSGRKITNPVWFVLEEDKLCLLPVKGSDSDWYKNVLKNPVITITADGKTWTGKGLPTRDAARVREVVDKFREKYGAEQVKKYYSKFDAAVEVPINLLAH